jgi:Double zinc ribbon
LQCPRCQHENPAHAKFCLECGARLALTCATCRSELPGSAKFCLECGERVTEQRQPRSPESYTPKHLAEKILSSNSALEGERKQVTVLFADLRSWGAHERVSAKRATAEDARRASLIRRVICLLNVEVGGGAFCYPAPTSATEESR